MKLITLNAWGGIAGEVLLEFLASKQDVDIFCFQEIFNGGQDEPAELREPVAGKRYHLWQEIQAALPNHVGYFQPSLGHWYGLATFVKKDLPVTEERVIPIHGQPGTIPEGDLGNHPRILQDIVVQNGEDPVHIMNVHGLWNGRGKTDCPERIAQSQCIVDYVQTCTGRVVLCGDFNLLPNTQSVRMIEEVGMENLITTFGITSTRTSRYTKPEKYADYVFVSPQVRVQSFAVLPDNVSDHAALVLDFS